MPYFRKVVGERCYLSPIDPADAPAFTAWLNDAEVAAGVTFTRRVVNVEQERDGLARLAAKPFNYEKCGFTRCGYWPDSWYHDGTLHGTVQMYLLRADFVEG